MKHWLLGITFGLSMLCLMSYLDDGYEIKEIDNQELIEAQKAAKQEQAERKIERDYLTAKAGNMTEIKVPHEHKVETINAARVK